MRKWITLGAVAAGVGAAALATPGGVATAATVGNPMAGNLGFGTVVRDDVLLGSTETEGTVALGGNLSVGPLYNVAVHATATYTAPGDSRATALLVGGRFDTTGSAPNGVVRVLNDYYVKIGDLTGVKALNTNNGAPRSTRVVPAAGTYTSTPSIELASPQPIASVRLANPSPIDFASLFATYRQRARDLGSCASNVTLADANGTALPQQSGFPSGTRAYITLTPGVTNVLTISAADLDNLAELTFRSQPTATTPFVVVVTGTSFSGSTPNLAGVSGQQAPYMLWDFPDATAVTLRGGDSIEGTLYAPSAALTDLDPSNIEGDIVARDFAAGPKNDAGGWVNAGEIHDFPFAAELSCEGGGSSSSSSAPTSSALSPSETSLPTTLPTTPEGSDPGHHGHPGRPGGPGEPGDPGDELAHTGADSTPLLVLLVIGLSGAGVVLSMLGRRRNGRHVA